MQSSGFAAEFARLAGNHDLGSVRRIHRSRRSFLSPSFSAPIVGGLLLGAALYFNDLEVLAFLVVPLAVGGAMALVYLGDTNERRAGCGSVSVTTESSFWPVGTSRSCCRGRRSPPFNAARSR